MAWVARRRHGVDSCYRARQQEPEDGFDLAILSPKETGLPFAVFILEDMGIVPNVRVEVARSARACGRFGGPYLASPIYISIHTSHGT
jgi:hypothetical protein